MSQPLQKSLTRNQSLVFEALRVADNPLSAYTILDNLRDEGFRAPLQVYRALEKLTELGMIHRLESLNAFVACRDPQCLNHETTAFAICEKCGGVEEFANDGLKQNILEWAKTSEFALQKTTIELRGVCKACTLKA